jgi:hypothetical protein
MPSHYPLTVQYNRHDEADIALFEQEAISKVRYRKGEGYAWITQTLTESRITQLMGLGYQVEILGDVNNSDTRINDLETQKNLLWSKQKLQDDSINNHQTKINSAFEDRTGLRNRIANLEIQKDKLWDRTDFAKWNHSHGDGGNGKDCGFLGFNCWAENFFKGAGGSLLGGGSLPMLAIAGVGAYLLLKKK